MPTNTEFVAKNGLVANGTLIVAKGGTGRVGINTDNPSANLDIVGTANVSGNVAMSGITSMNVVLVSANATVGNTTSNVYVSGTQLVIAGPSSNVSANATYITVGSNLSINTTTFAIGNSSVNAAANSSMIRVGGSVINATGYIVGNTIVTIDTVQIGNSTVKSFLTANAISTTGTLTVGSNAVFSSNVSVTGHMVIDKSLTINGNVAITGNVNSTFPANTITSGVFDAERLATGTANTSTFLCGDRTWKVGPIGYAGSIGATGPIGYSGSAGPQGPQGIQGVQGPLGYTGSIGVTGAQGIAGPTGSQGPLGYTGSIGATVSQGAQGAQGIQGAIGYTGSIGGTGPQGPLGYTGSIGATGAGIQGVTGYTGSIGGTGPQGPIGYTGSVGAQGTQGIAGPTGAQGPAGGFTTNSDARVNSLGVGTAASTTAGEIRAIGDIVAFYSDMRLKDKVGDIPDALAKVLNLNGFYYRANETAQSLGYDGNQVHVGLSAQEVQSVMPEIIREAPISAEYLTLDYAKLVPLLIEAIKELNAKICS